MRSALRLHSVGIKPNSEYTLKAIYRTISNYTGQSYKGKKDIVR